MTKRKPLNRGKQKEKSTGSRPENPGGSRRDDQVGGQGAKPRQVARQSWRPETTTSRSQSDKRNRGVDKNSGRARNRAHSNANNNAGNTEWLYGTHPVHEALKNPRRTLHRLIATSKAANALPPGATDRIRPELATADEIAELLPEGAVHQGLTLHAAPLPDLALEDVMAPFDKTGASPLLFLDQVSDPHNVGAILRSAAAFGAAAVIVQDRHAPQVTGTLAKSASGAVEHIPLIRVTNLSRALEAAADAGYFRLGLAGEADEVLGTQNLSDKIAIVLGAEGPGLRRLTREKCDLLVKLPTHEPISSLNVSNAAAVALFAVSK